MYGMKDLVLFWCVNSETFFFFTRHTIQIKKQITRDFRLKVGRIGLLFFLFETQLLEMYRFNIFRSPKMFRSFSLPWRYQF